MTPRRPSHVAVAVAALTSAFTCALTGCMPGVTSTRTTVTVHDNGATAMPSSAASGQQVTGIPGDGTFRVGVDIQAGTYRSAGSDSCYWARLFGLSGSLNDIIANSGSPGPQIVQIAPSDAAFKTQGCPDWDLVTPSATGARPVPGAIPA